MSNTTVKICSTSFADTFLGEHRWAENWSDSDTAGKSEALVNATNIILKFCVFFDDENNQVTYSPESETDPNIPDWLRQACCYEALYLLDLENDPARPFPLGILGIIKSGSETFDHNYEPPLFSSMAKQVLKMNYTVVTDPFADGCDWGRKLVLG